MAGSWGMTDEQYAAADKRYRRRWLVVTIGYVLAGFSQLVNYLIEDASLWALAAGVGLVASAAGAAFVWRRGMPDTRPASQREQ